MRKIVLAVVGFFALAADIPASGWKITSDTDPLTNVRSEDLKFPGAGGSLILVCHPDSKKARLVVIADNFVGGARVRDVEYRVGSSGLQRSLWRYGNDRAAEPFRSDELIRLIGHVREGGSAVFRLLRYDRATLDITIDLTGAQDAVTKWQGVCGIDAADRLKADAG